MSKKPKPRRDPLKKWKKQLQEIYDDRPIYAGREYNQLHKWYTRLAELLK